MIETEKEYSLALDRRNDCIRVLDMKVGSHKLNLNCSGVARQLCARGRAMKLVPPAPSLFFQISKFSFQILEFKF